MGGKGACLSTTEACSLGQNMPVEIAPGRYAVVVSGASFAGMALACGLARALGPENRVCLIDLRAGPGTAPRDARASAISAASKYMLEALGAWSGLAEEAQP